MAVDTLKSKAITDRDAGKAVDATKLKGTLFEAVGQAANTASASLASTYRLAQIPSNARMSQLLLYTSGQQAGSTGDLDIGLYKTIADGGLVVDVDFFKAAQDINAAALNGLDVTHGNVITHAKADEMIWQLLGLDADPGINYDIVATCVEAIANVGSILMKAKYTV